MLEAKLSSLFTAVYVELYGERPDDKFVSFQKTRPEFDGDMTIVVFPFTKILKKSPENLANELGQAMMLRSSEIDRFNVVKGFLNIVISDHYWLDFLKNSHQNIHFGTNNTGYGKKVLVEYSSPNTNKPLHLGHVRNNLLGWSVAALFEANGYEVVKVNLVNDRGIHICKSMLAWQKWGQKSPEETGMKGDKLVGEMYVRFDKALKSEIAELISKGMDADRASKEAPILVEAHSMLRKWEAGDPEIRQLWEKMNAWVYDGFDKTYKQMGIDFDKIYYESETYLLGKDIVAEGIKQQSLIKKEDGSVWCNLTEEGLDEKLLLRSDGTSVYMTQDLGTAQLRMNEFHADKMLYVVGNEQNYHFDVLKLILKKLGKDWADAIEHLSYGMVELPAGKMKSREGTVVDADELMLEMIQTARDTTLELGKSDQLAEQEAKVLFEQIGLGALKYFILKVDPKKTMLFNPAESIDFNGNTGPFIQYTHARIRSILRKAEVNNDVESKELTLNETTTLPEKEKRIVRMLYFYPQIIMQACESRSPAIVANYMYDLAKEFNQFYQLVPILKEENEQARNLRIAICSFVAQTIKNAGSILGMQMPEKM